MVTLNEAGLCFRGVAKGLMKFIAHFFWNKRRFKDFCGLCSTVIPAVLWLFQNSESFHENKFSCLVEHTAIRSGQLRSNQSITEMGHAGRINFQFTTRFLSCAETVLGSSYNMPSFLARDDYSWFIGSFVLENFWSALTTLGNYHLYFIYSIQSLCAVFERTAGQSIWKNAATRRISFTQSF